MDFQPPKTNLHDILTDPTIPLWKKDLIVRKRNTNRLLFGNLKLTCGVSLSQNSPSTIQPVISNKHYDDDELSSSADATSSSDDAATTSATIPPDVTLLQQLASESSSSVSSVEDDTEYTSANNDYSITSLHQVEYYSSTEEDEDGFVKIIN